jgi:hypothetical protein
VLRHPDIQRPEPRWPAVLAIFASAALHITLPPGMRIGPPWLIASTVVALVAVAWTTRRAGLHDINEWAGLAIVAVLTAGLFYGLGGLLIGLVHHTELAPDLLRSASTLWVTNVLVFATLYWRIDAGGPNARERHDAHTRGAFLFPQMTFSISGASLGTIAEEQRWRPGYVDYLFVAFNTSTAFSPTDVPVLSRWAKVAMMTQSVISLVTVVLLAGRAVNIL